MDKKLFCNTIAHYKAERVSGIDSAEWSGGAHCYLPSLKFYGRCSQSGTPSPDSPVDIYCNNSTYVLTANGKYFYPPDLRGIGEYTDEWDYVTGKGLRYIHKIEIDGVSEYGKVSTYSQNGIRVGIYTPEFPMINTNGAACVLSTHFKSSWNSTHGCIYANSGGIRLIFDNSLFPSGQSVIDWLLAQKKAGTPVTIYYVMEEPIPFEGRYDWDVYEPIPNESGKVLWGDGNISGVPVEVTYITHS